MDQRISGIPGAKPELVEGCLLPADMWWEVLRWLDTGGDWRWLVELLATVILRAGFRLPKPLQYYTPYDLLDNKHYGYAVVRHRTWVISPRCRLAELSAECGHIPTLRRYREYVNEDELLGKSAGGGHLEAMRICRDWGATDFNGAMVCAATRDQIAALRLCKEWGARNFDTILIFAAGIGQEKIMRLSREWGATEFTLALMHAISRDQEKAMQLCREWGAIAPNFGEP